MNEKLKYLLFKNLYTSILFQLIFIAVIGFSMYDIVKHISSNTPNLLYICISDAIYALAGVGYFACTYSNKISIDGKKLAARICIYILTLTFFIFQTFVL